MHTKSKSDRQHIRDQEQRPEAGEVNKVKFEMYENCRGTMVQESETNKNGNDEQQQPLNVLYPSLQASSDIAEALFGDFGRCWGDFGCSYARIPGRLFACTEAILFYNSFLGLENKICLKYQDIMEIELYRTTSIRVTVFEGLDMEKHVIRSFKDRARVLQLINFLKALAENEAGRLSLSSSTYDFGKKRLCESSEKTLPTFLPPAQSRRGNRLRSLSDSCLRIPLHDKHLVPGMGERSVMAESEDGEQSISYYRETNGSSDQTKESWEKIKRPENLNLKHIGIESLVLGCSLDKFFETFLADGALYSLDRYQRETIKDFDVNITSWDIGGDDGHVDASVRTLSFCHPVKNSFTTSEAHTSRRQRLRRFHDYGISLESTTTVKGVPYSDHFYTHDLWLIEATGDGQVTLSARYDTRFTKRCMVKSLINSNVCDETKSWFKGYCLMLQSVIAEDNNETEPLITSCPSATEKTATKEKTSAGDSDRHSIHTAIALIGMFLLATTINVLWMRHQFHVMQAELNSLKNDMSRLVEVLNTKFQQEGQLMAEEKCLDLPQHL